MVTRQREPRSIRDLGPSLDCTADRASRRLLGVSCQSVWPAILKQVSLRSFLCLKPVLFFFSQGIASPVGVSSGTKHIHPTNVFIQKIFFEHPVCAGNTESACDINPWVMALEGLCKVFFSGNSIMNMVK